MDRLRALRLPAIGLLVFLCASFSARADLIHLANGKILRGEVIQEDDKYYTIRVAYGVTKISKDRVDYVERETQMESAVGLGLEYLDHSNYLKAKETLEELVRKNPDDKAAKLALAKVYGAYGKQLGRVHRLGEAEYYLKQQLILKPGDEDTVKLLNGLQQARGQLDTLINAARAAIEKKDWENAVRAFDEAFSYSPDARDQISGDLSQCLVRLAQQQYLTQHFPESTLNLERAFGFNPGLADKLEKFYVNSSLSWAGKLAKDGKLDQSSQVVKHALELAPTNKHILFFAGNIEEATKNLPAAAEYYARAMRKPVVDNSAEAVAEMRKKIETELGLESKADPKDTEVAVDTSKSEAGEFQVLESTHFKIYHHNDKLAAEVSATIEAQYDRITQLMNYQPLWKDTDRPKVYIHRTQDEYTLATQQPEWTGGVSRYVHMGGKLVKMEIHSWQTSPRLLKSVIPHELTHLIVNSQLPTSDVLPRAMHEGYSVLMEPAYRQNYFLGFLRMRLKSNDFIPLAVLLDTRNYPSDPDFFYAEGFALVEYLVKTKGMQPALSLVTDGRGGGDISARLLGLTGMSSMSMVEQDWKRWLLKNNAVTGE